MDSKPKSLKINAALNAVKQVCMILFPMITFPYASRVLGVDNYGKVNFGLSIVSYIALIAALGITNYSIREGARLRSDEEKIQKFIKEIFTLNVYSTIFAYIILFLLLLFWKHLTSYGTLIIVQSTAVFFTTLGVDWVNSIYEDYLYITLRYISCQVIAVILMFLLVKNPQDFILYSFVSTSSTILANIWNVFHIKKYNVRLMLVPFKDIKKHMGPVIILFGSAVASLIYISSDVTILGILSSDKRVGYYSVSVKIYTLIKQVVNAVLVVAIPRFSHELSKGNREGVNKQLGQLQDFLIVMIGPIATGLFLLSRDIIVLFAGEEYTAAYSSLRILSLAILFATLANFYINVIMIPFKKEKVILFATIVSAVANIILNFVFIPALNEDGAASATVIAELIMLILGIVATRKIIQFYPLKAIFFGVLSSVAVYAGYFLVQLFKLSNVLTILLTVVASFISIIIILGVGYYREFRMMLGLKYSK